MGLPSPLPDNPLKWDGWRAFQSENPYERLCLDFDANPSAEQIEDHCRQLAVWWQKKLPLKNQPSNPLTQLLRVALDEAPKCIAEARTILLNPEERRKLDLQLRSKLKESAFAEFNKFFSFATSGGVLPTHAEANLYRIGAAHGLQQEEMKAAIDAELERIGAKRQEDIAPPAAAPVAAAPGEPVQCLPGNRAAEEFMRMLKLSKLSDDDMTDDQRDALCNMGESLGLTGGQAEDVIDEYLELTSGMPVTLPISSMAKPKPVVPNRSEPPVRKPEAAIPAHPTINTSPLARAQEKARYPNFTNSLGMEMLLVTSGVFQMGSNAPDAGPNEQPVTPTTVSCFHISRFLVTNALFEKFDPRHRAKRAPWADDNHPVIYVSSLDAIHFCEWLSAHDHRRYRLPTEAEWEFAARGMDGRAFPWGEKLGRGDLANFADANTTFAWRDPEINDGFAETSPVGAFPRGASPFGIEDMAGNVWEWCLDFFAPYLGKDRVNPRSGTSGSRRVYRGGSWKSRASNLRATARGYNVSDYSSNDVGFRVICECD
jgi:formylglycine-generating enzyme required for sulfatase activity